MKVGSKHLLYLAAAIFVNFLFALMLVFREDLIADIGEAATNGIGFFIQMVAAIVMLLGVFFSRKAFRRSRSFNFWLFATLLAAVPVVYYFFV